MGDQILGAASTTSSSGNQLQEWVINPIENYPAQWNVNHALKYPTPWSYSSQELLFDFRSHALSNTMRSYDFLTKNQQRIINEERMDDNAQNDQMKSSSSKLRGSSSNHKVANTTTTSSDLEIEESDEISFNENTETSLVSLSKAIAITNTVSNNKHSTESTVDDTSPFTIGASSNYLFCPSAHAKFTPEFLKISKFGGELVTDEDLEEDNNVVVDPFAESEEIDLRDRNHPHDEQEDQTESSDSNALVPANSFTHKKIIKDDTYMSILLPASAVSGGTIMPRRDEPWIELGCQVLSAKIVNGVDFLGADKENITS